MNTEQTNVTVQNGEIVFRICGYAMTGFLCSLFVTLIILLFFALNFFLENLWPETMAVNYSWISLSYKAFYQIIFFVSLLTVPTILGWFLAFLYPLKSKSQTWGMKLFGLKAVKPTEESLSWKTALLQEGLMMVSCTYLIIGLLGLVWALFDSDEKTVFNKISGVSIVQDQARLKFVNEFREYRKNKV